MPAQDHKSSLPPHLCAFRPCSDQAEENLEIFFSHLYNKAEVRIAAYDQEAFDELRGLDGKDEMTVYLAAVGSL